MTDEPDSIVLRYLRRLDAKVDRIDARLEDLSGEVRSLKTHMAGFMQSEATRDSADAELRMRVGRIERRLDLQDGIEP